MSEYPLVERKRKSNEQGTSLVSERIPVASLPRELRPAAMSPDRHIGLLQTVSHSGLTAMLDAPFALFQSPLLTSGFASAGQNAVGLVIQPRPRGRTDELVRFLTNSSTVFNQWGHTALYVRVDGRIASVIGFDPFKISRDVALRGTAITQGTLATPGHYNNDAALFQNMSARSVEYAVDRDLAMTVLAAMPHHGPATTSHAMRMYVGSPGKFLSADASRSALVYGNCISFAMNTLNQHAGANIFALGTDGQSLDTAVVDLGGRGMANQGNLVKQLLYVDKKTKKTLVLRFNDGREVLPVVGQMPTSFVIIKGMTHLYMVSSVMRFTAPQIGRLASYMSPSLYSMMPAIPSMLQTGRGAQLDTMNAVGQFFGQMADQYVDPEVITWLQRIGFLVGTAYICYGGGEDYVEIVYGVLNAVLPYLMEWLAGRVNRLTGY